MSAGSIASGEYVLGEVLGHGGSAHVFRARKTAEARDLAAKIIPIGTIDDPLAVVAHYQQVARLEHPHILPILDVGLRDDAVFVVSPIAAEGSLRQVLQRRQVDVKFAVTVITQIADALQYAHEHGIVHLDVKPGNILLASGRHPLLADFGLRQSEPRSPERARVRGTPAYMAPEQCTLAPTGPATDQYSLAVTSFELLTGRRPFMAGSPHDLLRSQVFDPPPPPATVRPGLPRELNHVLGRALAKDPRQRFPSVAALAAAVAGTMAGASSAPAPVHHPTTVEDRTLDLATLDLRPTASGHRM